MIQDSIDAVIVVDMQDGFLQSFKPEEKYPLIAAQIEVLNISKDNDIPVVSVEYEDCGKTVRIIANEIRKHKYHDFITKDETNGFCNSRLKAKLDEWNVRNIYLMGIYANACVRDTALGALENGFGVLASTETIADYAPRAMDFAKSWFKYNGVFLPHHKQILERMTREKSFSAK